MREQYWTALGAVTFACVLGTGLNQWWELIAKVLALCNG